MEKRLSHVMISVIIVCDRSQLVVRSEATTTLHRDRIGCRRRYREFPPSNFFEIFVTYQSLLEHQFVQISSQSAIYF